MILLIGVAIGLVIGLKVGITLGHRAEQRERSDAIRRLPAPRDA